MQINCVRNKSFCIEEKDIPKATFVRNFKREFRMRLHFRVHKKIL